MADVRYITAQSTPSVKSSDGDYLALQGTRDGALFSADWFLARAMEGRMFGVNIGAGTTPVTGNGALVTTTPDLHLYVPTTVAVIPAQIVVKYEAIGTESEMEVVALASKTADSAVTGTALTIYNMRMDAPVASLCTATRTVTAGLTDPAAGNRLEFFRAGHPLADTPATTENDRNEHVYKWAAMTNGVPPIIYGDGSLSLWAASQAATHFIFFSWVELPISRFS